MEIKWKMNLLTFEVFPIENGHVSLEGTLCKTNMFTP